MNSATYGANGAGTRTLGTLLFDLDICFSFSEKSVKEASTQHADYADPSSVNLLRRNPFTRRSA